MHTASPLQALLRQGSSRDRTIPPQPYGGLKKRQASLCPSRKKTGRPSWQYGILEPRAGMPDWPTLRHLARKPAAAPKPLPRRCTAPAVAGAFAGHSISQGVGRLNQSTAESKDIHSRYTGQGACPTLEGMGACIWDPTLLQFCKGYQKGARQQGKIGFGPCSRDLGGT